MTYPLEAESIGIPVLLVTDRVNSVNKQPWSIESVGWGESDGTPGVGVHKVEECSPEEDGGGVDGGDLLKGIV
jgi:hypothetical protein